MLSRSPPRPAPRSPEQPASHRRGLRGHLGPIAVTVASGVIVLTCSAARDRTEHAASPTNVNALSASAPTPSEIRPMELLGSASPIILAAPEASASPPRNTEPGHAGHVLSKFYASLRGLEKHTRKEHVRILWLGDSHGASDFWSGALRTALQKQFNSGGTGFVHVGNRGYRHDGIKMEISGRWRMRPKGPSTTLPTGDGIFGLSGILMSAEEPGARASLTVTAPDPSLGQAPTPTKLRWDLCYKLATPRDEILVKLTGAPSAQIRVVAKEDIGKLRHLVLTTYAQAPTLNVTTTSGVPELCGVIIETDPSLSPGVVLDTLGINGARLATPLAWDETTWVEELSRRAPDLVILEYGTNESGDYAIQPAMYIRHLTRLMDRVRRASPACDCLVLAPTDRADTQERTPKVRDALVEAAAAVGCGFWDTYAIMGGKGAILAWRSETPPRAAPDGVHLNYRGYHELGERLAADLLDGYRH